MTVCADGHIVTQQDLAAVKINTESAFAQAKADGHIPLFYELVLHDSYSSMAGVRAHQVHAGLQNIACFTPKKIQATLLHEAGHTHQRESPATLLNCAANFLLAAAIITIPLYRMARLALFKAANWQRSRRNWILVSPLIAAFAISGHSSFRQLRDNEYAADLYAARAMGTPDPMQSVLADIKNIKFDFPESVESSGNDGGFFMKQVSYITLMGPFAYFTDHHPSDRKRIIALEKRRAEIEHAGSLNWNAKNNPALLAP